ncbi:DUF6479 family protein [Streptomyces sp. NPDC005485]|uniref:DUF6479 family protein n=1 Tax=Streptomyces sp. NPDC005485 TaxID=3155591 RepID=UPI0033BED5C2
MTALSTEIAASLGFLGIAPLIAGVIVVAGLIWAVRLGIRVRRREPAPPRPEEQPRLPEDGPVSEIREYREPDEVPRSGDRLTPHRLKAHGNISSRPSPSKKRPRWDEGNNGSFGSGGPGPT